MRLVDETKYHIAKSGDPNLHHELEWYATDDDQVLGAVILDQIDRDFSWVVLTQNEQGPGYTCIDLGHSLPSIEIARTKLHAAMERHT